MILLVLYMGFPPTLGYPVAFFVVIQSVVGEIPVLLQTRQVPHAHADRILNSNASPV